MPNIYPDEPISVEQTLHGYENGHRLLSSSLELGTADQRALLMMSDLSGPRVVEEFLEYLTGYPLPSKKFYALAKTWYASEMKRPGCVWTHTFLLPAEDLSKLRNAWSILKLFRRPTSVSDPTYSGAIVIKEGAPVSWQSLPDPVVEVITQLYSQDEVPVALPAESGTQFESLSLKIWSQQWPRLRMNFAFCTGALSERTVNSRPLDLQFGPRRIVGNFGAHPMKHREEPNWVSQIVQDFASSNETTLQDFLWRVGSDLSMRTDLRKLANIYHILQKKGPKETIEAIQGCYPKKAQAKTLKQQLLSETSVFLGEGEGTVLRWLVELVDSDGFDSVDLEIERRAACLYRDNRNMAVEILQIALKSSRNPLRDQFVDGLARILSTSDFEQLSQFDSTLLHKLIRNHPEITHANYLWLADLAADEKAEMFRNLKNTRAADGALEAILRTQNYQAAALVTSQLEEEQIGTVLDWAAKYKPDVNILLRPEWLGFFRKYQNALVHWSKRQESIPIHVIVLLAQVLEAEAITSKTLDLEHEKLLDAGFGAQSLFEARHEVAALAFTLALTYSEERAAALASISFAVLHRAMAQSRLSYRAWQIVEPWLPIWDRDPWDNCERLRRSLLSVFQSRQWPPASLWDILKNDADLFSDMIRTSKQYPAGREVFSSIWRAIQLGQVSTSSKQAKDIRKLIGA